jgi:hypothetical protein
MLGERHIAKLASELATAQSVLAAAQSTAQTDSAKAATEIANITATVAAKDAEIVTLKKQVTDATMTPQKIAQAARARSAVEQRAKALFDSVVLTDDKSDADIRRQVVNAKMGEAAKEWTDDMVTASFNTLTVTHDSSGTGGLNQVVGLLRDNDFGGGDQKAKSYTEYNTGIENRWKTAGVRNTA